MAMTGGRSSWTGAARRRHHRAQDQHQEHTTAAAQPGRCEASRRDPRVPSRDERQPVRTRQPRVDEPTRVTALARPNPTAAAVPLSPGQGGSSVACVALPRRRLDGAAAPGRPGDAPRRDRRGLGRPGAALPGGSAGRGCCSTARARSVAAAARCATRRGHLHRPPARRRCTSASSARCDAASADRSPPGHQRRRALGGAARAPSGTSATAADVSSAPVDRTGRVDAEAYADVPAERHRAGLPAVRQPRGRHAAAGGRGRVAVPRPRRPAARRRRPDRWPLHRAPDGWSCSPRARTSGAGRPASACLRSGDGLRWRTPGPADEREAGARRGSRTFPLSSRRRPRSRPSAGRSGRAENRASAPLVDRIRRRVPQLVPDVEVVGHPTLRLPHLVTFSCLYVDGEALLTSSTDAGSPCRPGRRARRARSSRVTCSWRWACCPTATSGSRSPARTTDEDVDRFLAVLPGVVSRLRDTAGVGGL